MSRRTSSEHTSVEINTRGQYPTLLLDDDLENVRHHSSLANERSA